MRYLLMALVIAAAIIASGSTASAHGLSSRWGTRIGVSRPYVIAHYGYGYNNPYSLRFIHPYPQHYGRWDLYFNMHGAPPSL